MRIGLSLSFCVRDFLAKEVNPDKITWIVSCTRFDNIKQAYDHYKDAY